jgi:hypothetical protein
MPKRALALFLLLGGCDPAQIITGGGAGDGNGDMASNSPPDPGGADGGTTSAGDLGGHGRQPLPVGATGGAVSLLHFGISGDTRPPSCEDTAGYPTSVINGIVSRLNARAVQFALDLGDHMYVCNDDLPTATAQMGLFTQATQKLPATWFMTMGNHECEGPPCLTGSQNANYVAFMSALAPIASKPYYTFDVDTSLGRVTFVVVADSAWDANQSSWLDATLAQADQQAKYTIVARHHPEGDTSIATNSDSMAIIRNHKFALFLTGHSHLYKHMTTDNGRDLVLGAGGAPLIAGGAYYGYGVIDQLATGPLQVSIYDVSTDALQDQWQVGPNQ